MGQFIRQEIKENLDIDIHLGVKSTESCWDLSWLSTFRIALGSLAPVWSDWLFGGARSVPGVGYFWELGKSFVGGFNTLIGRRGIRDSSDVGKFLYNMMKRQLIFREGFGLTMLNSDEFRRAELPSFNIQASAKGMAKLAAFMANKGQFQGQTLISQDTWDKMHAEPKIENDVVFGALRTEFTQGGVNLFRDYSDDVKVEKMFKRGRNGSYGWIGFGGSTMVWNPDLQLGFGYAPTRITWYDVFNSNSAQLQEEVLRCIKRMSNVDCNHNEINGKVVIEM